MGVGNDKFPNLKLDTWLSTRDNLEADTFVESTFVRAIEALTKLALLRLSHVRQVLDNRTAFLLNRNHMA